MHYNITDFSPYVVSLRREGCRRRIRLGERLGIRFSKLAPHDRHVIQTLARAVCAESVMENGSVGVVFRARREVRMPLPQAMGPYPLELTRFSREGGDQRVVKPDERLVLTIPNISEAEAVSAFWSAIVEPTFPDETTVQVELVVFERARLPEDENDGLVGRMIRWE